MAKAKKLNNCKLYNEDCIAALKKIKPNSVDLIFADPPYNLSDKKFLTVKSGTVAKCDKGEWDKIDNIEAFNIEWITQCRRVLKDNGTIWISGTLHNHPSIGQCLKKLKFWIINDIIWFKRNAPPLLSRNRLVPSTELIWLASKNKKYYFNYEHAKKFNSGKQLRNMWEINSQRHVTEHPTEKPEILLERILEIGTEKKSIVLDPFMGSGTTGVVAKRYERNFIGIEINKRYFKIAKKRIGMTRVDQELKFLTA
jgi:site-specific DNA-methyltransferase (adenine-specific)|tara:strand:+ start:1833 stop:2594 length:762 start_codon:yes stop_codon:yes gene_type:complete